MQGDLRTALRMIATYGFGNLRRYPPAIHQLVRFARRCRAKREVLRQILLRDPGPSAFVSHNRSIRPAPAGKHRI
jgi:hypothetical protein